MITVVIVDDEPPARRKLARWLEGEADFRVVGEAGAGGAAVAVVEELRPDLLFLDVQLPDISGFAVLERLSETVRPLTVFVTAYDHYAVAAFEVRALDYLLKPVSQARFRGALERARPLLAASTRYLRRLVVKEEQMVYFVEVERVQWLESARNYVVVHTGSGTHIVRASLEGLLEQLDPGRFVRVSRSAAVNVAKLRAWSPVGAVLENGDLVKTSTRYAAGLRSGG